MLRFTIFLLIGIVILFLASDFAYAQQDDTKPSQNGLDIVNFIPIIISVGAFLLSIITLWKNHLSPFNLEVEYDAPSITLYKLAGTKKGSTRQLGIERFEDDEEENKKELAENPTDLDNIWWIPSINLDLTCYNTGQKLGKLNDVRMIAEIFDNNDISKLEPLVFMPNGW